ncbi:MAG: hypothetical protein HDS79_08700, partial [Bacteroidales bacterium]|nr:hypothetical protein [Bacteroidales bacterium]
LFKVDRPTYIFDFHLQEDSPVKEAGAPSFVTPLVRYDMEGTDRLIDRAPSLCAYQYQP